MQYSQCCGSCVVGSTNNSSAVMHAVLDLLYNYTSLHKAIGGLYIHTDVGVICIVETNNMAQAVT